jgi:phospholipase/carboxylesterase
MALQGLSGPRLLPADGKATHLVVLCHGYGADGNDLISFAPDLQRAIPGAAFVAPNAPQRNSESGYQWFELSRFDAEELESGVRSAAPHLNAFLDAELARLGLPPDRLALVGFSQGTMLALHVGLARGVCAIVGFSGMLASEPPPNPRPPILLTHGDSDQVIPPQAMLLAAVTLGRAGAAVQWHVARGIGHGIDAAALELAAGFLSLAFEGKLAPAGQVGCPVG